MLSPGRARWKGSINEDPCEVSRCFRKLDKTLYQDLNQETSSISLLWTIYTTQTVVSDFPMTRHGDGARIKGLSAAEDIVCYDDILLIAVHLFIQTAQLVLNLPHEHFSPSDPAYFRSRDIGWPDEYYDTHHLDFPNALEGGPYPANIAHTDTFGLIDTPRWRHINRANCYAPRKPLCDIPTSIGHYLLPESIKRCAFAKNEPTIGSDTSHLQLTLAEYWWAARCSGIPYQQGALETVRKTQGTTTRLANVHYISTERVAMMWSFTQFFQDSSWPQHHDALIQVSMGSVYMWYFAHGQGSQSYQCSFVEPRIMIKERQGKCTTQQTGSSSAPGHEKHRSTSKEYKKSSFTPSGSDRKRTANTEGCQDDDDHNGSGRGGEDHNPDKRRRVESEKTPRLACPFYKHNPTELVDERVCCGPGWSSVNRVKEHIFRRHRAPDFECSRCFADFKNDRELNDHYRGEQRCEIRDRSSAPPRVDARTERLLKQRRKSTILMTEEEKWNVMYKTIYPDETQVPSPYYEPKDLSRDVTFPSEATAQEMFRRNLTEILPAQSSISPALMDSIVRGTMAAFNKTFSTIYEQGTTSVSDPTMRNTTADIGGSFSCDAELDGLGKTISLANKAPKDGSTGLLKAASQPTSAELSELTACFSETGATQLSNLSGQSPEHTTQSPQQILREMCDTADVCEWPGCGKTYLKRAPLTLHQRRHAGDETQSERGDKSTSLGGTEETPLQSSLNEYRQQSSGANVGSLPETGAQSTMTSYGGCSDDHDGTIAPMQLPTRFNSWASSSTTWPSRAITPEYNVPDLNHGDWMVPEDLMGFGQFYDGEYGPCLLGPSDSIDNFRLPGE